MTWSAKKSVQGALLMAAAVGGAFLFGSDAAAARADRAVVPGTLADTLAQALFVVRGRVSELAPGRYRLDIAEYLKGQGPHRLDLVDAPGSGALAELPPGDALLFLTYDGKGRAGTYEPVVRLNGMDAEAAVYSVGRNGRLAAAEHPSLADVRRWIATDQAAQRHRRKRLAPSTAVVD